MSIEQTHAEKARVLIADDNSKMRNTVMRLLETEFEVVGAVADGGELLASAEKVEPDVCIVDISMPVMNGIEAVVEIKKRDSKIKFIFLTVHEDTDFVRAAFDAGAVGYVVKRQMATDLRVAIDRALTGQKFISPCCDHLDSSFQS